MHVTFNIQDSATWVAFRLFPTAQKPVLVRQAMAIFYKTPMATMKAYCMESSLQNGWHRIAKRVFRH